MRYPIVIETGDAKHAFGVVVPDLPGCFSAGDTLDDALTNARRYCTNCGHANRLTAKICVNCGQAFPPISLDSPTESVSLAAKPNRTTSDSSTSVKRAKRCPVCATICKLDANVCPNCGHYFQTDFSGAGSGKPSPAAVPDASRPVLTEGPIVQMPSTGVTLPPDNPTPVKLPPVPAPVLAPTAIPAPPPSLRTLPPGDAADGADSTEGEPAPDLTDVDLTALRRRSNDPNSRFFTRNGLFKKDNS